jgi:hypothetical protein
LFGFYRQYKAKIHFNQIEEREGETGSQMIIKSSLQESFDSSVPALAQREQISTTNNIPK